MFDLTRDELLVQNAALKEQLTKALAKVAKLQGQQTCSQAAEIIYQHYPRKIGKGAAIKAIKKALTKTTATELELKVKQYASSITWQEKHLIPHPATWFNREGWHDDPQEWENPNKQQGGTQFSL